MDLEDKIGNKDRGYEYYEPFMWDICEEHSDFIKGYHDVTYDRKDTQDLVMSYVTGGIGLRETWYNKPTNPQEALKQLGERVKDDVSLRNFIFKNKTISHYLND